MTINHSITVSITINAALKKVWDALTVPEQIKSYMFGTNTVTDWKVGSPIFFRGEWEGKSYEDKGHVLSFEPESSFSYDYWSSFSGIADKPELYQTVRFDLKKEQDGILLTITQSNIDSQKRADDSSKTWNMILGELKKYVEK